jgi:hypothetical protein
VDYFAQDRASGTTTARQGGLIELRGVAGEIDQPYAARGDHVGEKAVKVLGRLTALWRSARGRECPLVAGSGGSQLNCPRSSGYDSDRPTVACSEWQLSGSPSREEAFSSIPVGSSSPIVRYRTD